MSLGTLIRGAVVGALLVLGGCGGPPPPPPPTIVNVAVTAGPDINPDGSGHPAPVLVRIYQLAGDGAFKNGDFFQIYGKEDAALGKDLVAKDDVMMVPGTSQTVTIPAKPDTKMLGVLVAFRDIDKASWRQEAPVPPNKTTNLTLAISGLEAKLSGP